MRTRVKICGITRIEDGLAAARAGADAIGLVFWSRTPRVVSRAQAKNIVAALPPFVTVVGLFVDPDVNEVRATLAEVALEVLQFHGDEEPEFCRQFDRPYVKAVSAKPRGDLLQYAARYPDAHGLLFDAHLPGGMPGGTGTTFDWSVIPPNLPRPLILSGGLTVDNVGNGIRRLRPWGVDVSSGVEATDAEGRPVRGIKDPAKIVAFIKEVRNADV